MGVSIDASAIIGVKLPRPPFKDVEERGCSHATQNKAVEFCPECGKKTWIKTSRPLPGYDEGNKRFADFFVLEGGSREDPDYYVGINPLTTDDCMYSPPGVFSDIRGVDVNLLRGGLKHLLEPLGLWNDNIPVGLWVFSLTSC